MSIDECNFHRVKTIMLLSLPKLGNLEILLKKGDKRINQCMKLFSWKSNLIIGRFYNGRSHVCLFSNIFPSLSLVRKDIIKK